MRRLGMPLFLGACSFLGGVAAVTVVPRLLALPAFAQGAALLGTPGPAAGAAAEPPRGEVGRLSERFEWVARKVMPAVVSIDARKARPNGKDKEESGSGVLVRVAGQRGTFALTNNHVVDGSTPLQITVSLADNRILRPSRMWTDPETDVAVLRLDAEDLPAATLGDSDSARVGHWVLAFGSPFGLNQSVTHGIVSARDRGQIGLGSSIRIKEFLQIDAAINSGNSGGPLANLDGEVIGINTAIASHSGDNSGVAFSIPANLVRRVVGQLLEKGAVTRGYLGLQVARTFEAPDAARLGLDRAQGALVETVYPDTPAAKAGLRANDVVLQVDGVVVRNENHFINVISGYSAGQPVRLRVWRERREVAVGATVGDWSAGQSRFRAAP